MFLERGLYKIRIKVKINQPDTIIVLGIRNVILYYGKIDPNNNILEFNYPLNGCFYEIKHKNTNDFNILVLGLNIIYEYNIINIEEITPKYKVLVIGDSHSYLHQLVKYDYYSWFEYWHYIIGDYVELINFTRSGVNIKDIIYKYNYVDLITNNYEINNICLFMVAGANTEKKYNINKYEEYYVEYEKIFKLNWKDKILCKMYPVANSIHTKKILRANKLIDLFLQLSNVFNIKYFDIDDIINDDKYDLSCFVANDSHTNLIGSIFVGERLKKEFKNLGYNIFNENKILTKDDCIIINKILHSHKKIVATRTL